MPPSGSLHCSLQNSLSTWSSISSTCSYVRYVSEAQDLDLGIECTLSPIESPVLCFVLVFPSLGWGGSSWGQCSAHLCYRGFLLKRHTSHMEMREYLVWHWDTERVKRGFFLVYRKTDWQYPVSYSPSIRTKPQLSNLHLHRELVLHVCVGLFRLSGCRECRCVPRLLPWDFAGGLIHHFHG